MTNAITTKFFDSVSQLTQAEAPWEIVAETINAVDYQIYKNAPTSLATLLDEGRKHGDNEFLVYQDERITFNTFFAQVDKLAALLQTEFNIQKGDTVAIAMRNYPEWMISFAAIVYSGAIVVPINSWSTADDLHYALNDAAVKIAFLDQQRFDLLQTKTHDLNANFIVAKGENNHPNAIGFTDLLSKATVASPQPIESHPEDTAIIMYTSGTTGHPKGVVSSHRNVSQSVFNYEMLAIATAMSDSEPVGKMLERGFPPKVLLSVPLFHVAGCYSVFLLSLRGGRPIVMMYKWDKIAALSLIEKERITMISAVPSMIMEMLDSPEWANFDTQSMFGFGTGGAAQPPRLAELVYEKMPDSYPGTGYGMTESNACGFAATGGIYAVAPKSTGLKMPIVNIKILDEQGKAVSSGEAGEIWLQSPTVAKGYLNNPEATASTFIDGWLKTGDVGYLDASGYLFITDRVKDMIIRGGENIYSSEIEAAALHHSDILEAAAFGMDDEVLGEEVALAVTIKPSAELTEQELSEFLKNRLAHFKLPRFIFIRHEPLPKNVALKVVKATLKEQYQPTIA